MEHRKIAGHEGRLLSAVLAPYFPIFARCDETGSHGILAASLTFFLWFCFFANKISALVCSLVEGFHGLLPARS